MRKICGVLIGLLVMLFMCSVVMAYDDVSSVADEPELEPTGEVVVLDSGAEPEEDDEPVYYDYDYTAQLNQLIEQGQATQATIFIFIGVLIAVGIAIIVVVVFIRI